MTNIDGGRAACDASLCLAYARECTGEAYSSFETCSEAASSLDVDSWDLLNCVRCSNLVTPAARARKRSSSHTHPHTPLHRPTGRVTSVPAVPWNARFARVATESGQEGGSGLITWTHHSPRRPCSANRQSHVVRGYELTTPTIVARSTAGTLALSVSTALGPATSSQSASAVRRTRRVKQLERS